jgi:hypothetical protein
MSKSIEDIKAYRQNLREQYQKIYQNPFNYKHAIADPAVSRYEAARAFSKEYYKPTPRTIIFPFCVFLLGYATYKYVINERAEINRKIMSGETTYADRGLYSSRYLF